MKPFSINSTSTKITFNDETSDIIIVRGTKSLMTICDKVKTVIISDGKVAEVSDKFYALVNDFRKMTNFASAEVIGYLARCTEIENSPSIAVNAKAFGKNVNPGHSFKAEMDFENGEDRNGIYVPKHFKPFVKPEKTVSFGSMCKVEDQHPTDAPHPSEDPANFDAQV